MGRARGGLAREGMRLFPEPLAFNRDSDHLKQPSVPHGDFLLNIESDPVFDLTPQYLCVPPVRKQPFPQYGLTCLRICKGEPLRPYSWYACYLQHPSPAKPLHYLASCMTGSYKASPNVPSSSCSLFIRVASLMWS